MARCPAHQDRTPSLSVSQADDGRILMHCFAGCHIADVTAAIGFEVKDLFPAADREYYRTMPEWKSRRYQEALIRERMIISMAKSDIEKGLELSAADMQRVKKAVEFIRKFRRLNHG